MQNSNEKRIIIHCQGCNKSHNVRRTDEIPSNVISMSCNWCPDCEDKAEDWYQEWYNYNDNDGSQQNGDIPDNQLVLPFILDEIIGKAKDYKQENISINQ